MEGDQLTPLHPNHVKALRLGAVLVAIPPFVLTLAWEVVGVLPLPPGVALVPVLALLGWFVVRMPLRRHAARGYQMDADRLRVVRGLMWRKDTVVPFGRVQHIDIERGPIARYYGLSTLVLHTAGTHNASVSLPGLGETDAMEMREVIREKIRRDTL